MKFNNDLINEADNNSSLPVSAPAPAPAPKPLSRLKATQKLRKDREDNIKKIANLIGNKVIKAENSPKNRIEFIHQIAPYSHQPGAEDVSDEDVFESDPVQNEIKKSLHDFELSKSQDTNNSSTALPAFKTQYKIDTNTFCNELKNPIYVSCAMNSMVLDPEKNINGYDVNYTVGKKHQIVPLKYCIRAPQRLTPSKIGFYIEKAVKNIKYYRTGNYAGLGDSQDGYGTYKGKKYPVQVKAVKITIEKETAVRTDTENNIIKSKQKISNLQGHLSSNSTKIAKFNTASKLAKENIPFILQYAYYALFTDIRGTQNVPKFSDKNSENIVFFGIPDSEIINPKDILKNDSANITDLKKTVRKEIKKYQSGADFQSKMRFAYMSYLAKELRTDLVGESLGAKFQKASAYVFGIINNAKGNKVSSDELKATENDNLKLLTSADVINSMQASDKTKFYNYINQFLLENNLEFSISRGKVTADLNRKIFRDSGYETTGRSDENGEEKYTGIMSGSGLGNYKSYRQLELDRRAYDKKIGKEKFNEICSGLSSYKYNKVLKSMETFIKHPEQKEGAIEDLAKAVPEKEKQTAIINYFKTLELEDLKKYKHYKDKN